MRLSGEDAEKEKYYLANHLPPRIKNFSLFKRRQFLTIQLVQGNLQFRFLMLVCTCGLSLDIKVLLSLSRVLNLILNNWDWTNQLPWSFATFTQHLVLDYSTINSGTTETEYFLKSSGGSLLALQSLELIVGCPSLIIFFLQHF